MFTRVFPVSIFFLFSLCSSFSLVSNKQMFNYSKHIGFVDDCIIPSPLCLPFSPAFRRRGSESASRGGTGGVSHRVRGSPLPVHRWRRPNQAHTGWYMKGQLCVFSRFRSAEAQIVKVRLTRWLYLMEWIHWKIMGRRLAYFEVIKVNPCPMIFRASKKQIWLW